MPIDIPPIAEIAEKWERVTPGRAADYTHGVQNPRRSWMDATLEQIDVWIEAITQAIADGRWQRGVRDAGDRKWQANTLAKGPTRWVHGIRLARGVYRDRFQPYRDEIASIDLPPRGPRGDERNYERVAIIGRRLHALKLELGRGG